MTRNLPGSGALARASVLFAAALGMVAPVALHAGTPGLDAPVAIGPFLNGNFPDVEPTGASEWVVQEHYAGININLPMHVMPYPGTNKLVCVAKEGRIFLFNDDNAVATTETFLDLRTQTYTTSDSGMTWLVFHPKFGVAGDPNRGYVYLTYKWKPSGGNANYSYWRLSRFNVLDGTQVADPSSEQILIQQFDRQQFHDAGCMMFGPDGYLYLSIGDEGGANDEYGVAQKINDRLFSGILRIDVDQKPTSHAIRRQPAQHASTPAGWPSSYTQNYGIPEDNPFNNVSGANLEEFYAIGFRQPYRFSYDPVSNLTWVAESGQDTREELDILVSGGNYGWPFREGKIARPTGPQPPVVPSPLIGTLTEPVWDVAHGIDNCTIGGFVYRGTTHPTLVGKYLTVDNVTSHIRAHTLEGNVATNVILTDMPSGSVYNGTSTIGWDHAGDPILVKIDGTGTRGRFMKLATVPANTTHAGYFRFEDQNVANTTGFVSDNPGNATVNSLARGTDLVTKDNETTSSSNVSYVAGNGLAPFGKSASVSGVRVAATNVGVRPGNAAGELFTQSKLGVLNDFTVELSFHPNTGGLAGDYQCFIGLDGMTGTAPSDLENGPPIQPFRLMRWNRNNTGTSIPLETGDLFLNVRTVNPATQAWTSVPIHVIDKTQFTENKWYHLAIVGKVSTGTVTVYSYNSTSGQYDQIGQATGYVGNLQAGVWSVGRGCFSGNSADFVRDTTFDEVRISDTALPVSKLLYGTEAFDPYIPVTEPPLLLSETGAFSNLATLTPSPGVVPYGVNAPLWSDAAAKARWIVLPNDGTHNTAAEKIKFSPEADWEFPNGTVFIKHFELATDENNPSHHKRLETRFIVMPTVGEPYGITYKWRPDNSDADLMATGLDEVIDIATAGGGTRQQTWTYPSRGECRICHNGNADYVLGVKTQQLNGDYTYPLTGRTANQLETWGALGWFDAGYRADLVPWMLKSRNVADTTASLTDRVRSYLDSNCSQCHRPNGVRAFFDARYTTPVDEQGIIHGELENVMGSSANRVIAPGHPENSIMLSRVASVAEIRMPPLAKHLVDPSATQLITDWINSLATGPSATLALPSPPAGPFDVDVHFSEPVTGLTTGDFIITNGHAASLTGSGSSYLLNVVPDGFGVITVKLPEASAVGGSQLGNYASQTLTTTYVDSDLVTWLKFDEGAGLAAFDSSTGGNDGTLTGLDGTSNWVSGKFGGALAFGSSDERVTVNNVVGEDFSISFWMRTSSAFPLTNAPASGSAIFFADIGGVARDFIVAGTRVANGSPEGLNRISFQTGSPNTAIHGTTAVNTGEWVHVAITRKQSTGEMNIYVNGILQATATGSTAVLDQNPVLSIGATPGNAGASYQGDLDEIRIFRKTLTQGEVTGLANQTVPSVPAYQQWVDAWLPGIYHLHGRSADPEGDGVRNFGEFAFGNNPLASDIIPVPFEKEEDGSYKITYRARKSGDGASYIVKVSPDLFSWADASPDVTDISTRDIPGSDYEWVDVTYQPPVGGEEHQFFRIEATSN